MLRLCLGLYISNIKNFKEKLSYQQVVILLKNHCRCQKYIISGKHLCLLFSGVTQKHR